MHMADTEKNFWGGHAIVGAHIPIAAGLALGDVYQGNEDAVTICMFGDGATNIGFFHEGLNLSKVWNLPVLWVCENNQYGMGTAVKRASAVSEIRQKAEGYGMANEQIDGMDLMNVREKVSEVLDKVRSGGGPYLLEVMTYRYRGHSMGDPEKYREKEEVRNGRKRIPLASTGNTCSMRRSPLKKSWMPRMMRRKRSLKKPSNLQNQARTRSRKPYLRTFM